MCHHFHSPPLRSISHTGVGIVKMDLQKKQVEGYSDGLKIERKKDKYVS